MSEEVQGRSKACTKKITLTYWFNELLYLQIPTYNYTIPFTNRNHKCAIAQLSQRFGRKHNAKFRSKILKISSTAKGIRSGSYFSQDFDLSGLTYHLSFASNPFDSSPGGGDHFCNKTEQFT